MPKLAGNQSVPNISPITHNTKSTSSFLNTKLLLFKMLTHQRDMDLPRKYLTSIAQNQFLKRRLFSFLITTPSFDQVPSNLETTLNIKTDVPSRFRFVVAAVVAAIRQNISDLRKINLKKTEVATAQLKFDSNNGSIFLTTQKISENSKF